MLFAVAVRGTAWLLSLATQLRYQIAVAVQIIALFLNSKCYKLYRVFYWIKPIALVSKLLSNFPNCVMFLQIETGKSLIWRMWTRPVLKDCFNVLLWTRDINTTQLQTIFRSQFLSRLVGLILHVYFVVKLGLQQCNIWFEKAFCPHRFCINQDAFISIAVCFEYKICRVVVVWRQVTLVQGIVKNDYGPALVHSGPQSYIPHCGWNAWKSTRCICNLPV